MSSEIISTWNQLAEAYQEKFMSLSIYNDSYDAFYELINKEDPSVLEVGCGPGNITKYLLAKRPDLNLLATDASFEMLKLARQNVPQAKFQMLDARNMSSLAGKFDAIVCGFCLPYFDEAESQRFFDESFVLLNQNGILYVSVIEGNIAESEIQKSSDGKIQMMVHYYLEADLDRFANKWEFKKERVFRTVYQQTSSSKNTHLMVIYQKCKLNS